MNSTTSSTSAAQAAQIVESTVKTKKIKKLSWQNLAIGAGIQVFEVSTLGQPFEVIKTHMAGNNTPFFDLIK